ncbi:MAG: LPS assembly protein LptD [Phycisphaerae bacterium]|nr:LPS assembly protein LptD [Phycisphaerae bacterium]
MRAKRVVVLCVAVWVSSLSPLIAALEQEAPATTLSDFPINVMPVDQSSTEIQMGPLPPDGKKTCLTLLGRTSLWWKVDTYMVELQADNVVVFLSEAFRSDPDWYKGISTFEEAIQSGIVEGIYLSGDVVMSEGVRSIRAHEMFYDVNNRTALAVNAVMRTYDEERHIPVYVRAQKLQMVAQNVFKAEDVTLTTSEFHVPQVSLNVARILITDTMTVDEETGKITAHDFDAEMTDVRVKAGEMTLLRWPGMRSNLERPDIPLKRASLGHGGVLGTSVETEWYLSRVLGLKEPKDTDATLAVDYFEERGPGVGAEIDYLRDNYFGRMQGYLIKDHGLDRLGRIDSRRNLDPPYDERGRFQLQHRQFLPNQWQVTTEFSYLSDRNFLEQFERSEFDQEKEQETLVHMKRSQDNMAFALTSKYRINEFQSQVEEQPSTEFHWTGQSLFDDKFTFYSDSQVGRFRSQFDQDVTTTRSSKFYTLAMTRNELDRPIRLHRSKLVPFIAGNAGFEDEDGFYTTVQGETAEPKEAIWFGEAGLRFSLDPIWRNYAEVQSRLWDLNQMRHVIEPYALAVSYFEEEAVAKQRDVLNVGITQRWQTKRGVGKKQRTVDWLRWDISTTWVNEASELWNGPSHMMWNRPLVPIRQAYSGVVPGRDRRTSDFYGASRNYVGSEFVWRVSDSTAILGDCYYDMAAGLVRQTQWGISHMRWDDLNLYFGSSYLRDIRNSQGQVGTHVLTFSALYKLDPRYAMVLSHQYDTDFGASVLSEMTLLRKYHRLNYGLTFRVDESLDTSSVMFSLWPEGIQEVGMGRYSGLGI